MVEFGRVSWCPPLRGAELAAADEALGFDIRYFGDNSCFASDPFAELRDAARATSTIKLAVGSTNAVTRDTSVIANAIGAVQLASGGRAICGIGKGDSAMAVIGRGPQKHAAFETALRDLRAYLHGGAPEREQWTSPIRWIESADAATYTPVPIEVMCSGPRAIRLAAALADRVTLTVGAAPERVRWALEQLDAGLADAGRTRADVQIGAYMPVALADDDAAAAELLRVRVKGPIHMGSVRGADLAGQPEQLREATLAVREGYDYRHHNVRRDNPLGALVDPETAAWFGIGGTPATVAARLLELVELGFGYFFFADLPEGELQALAGDVMPAVRRGAAALA